MSAPLIWGEAVQAKRAGYAQTYFDKYAPKPTHPERLTEGYYRVRKTWADKKSQLGAYRMLTTLVVIVMDELFVSRYKFFVGIKMV